MKIRLSILVGLLLMGVMSVNAQESESKVTDAELESFAKAYQRVQGLNNEIRQKMTKVIQDEELSIQKFNAIQQAQQNPEKEVTATKEQLEKYNRCAKKLQEMQNGAQQKMKEAVANVGLTVQRYREITMSLQKDPTLQKRLQEWM